jgi:hypothetical protein
MSRAGARTGTAASPRASQGRAQPDYSAFCRERGVRRPAGVPHRLGGKVGRELEPLLYWPQGDPLQPNSLAHGLRLLDSAVMPAPPNLLPLIAVDSRSIACAVCVTDEQWGEPRGSEPGPAPCAVVRWHLGAIPPSEQGALLDSDASDYLQSIADEMAIRPRMLCRIRDVADWYQEKYVRQDRRPRRHVLRPIQVACQNVIVGLATARQDATFDGLRVEDYLACEAPHLAAHEGDRALLAMLLCEAFQGGGTMELRFGQDGSETGLPPSVMRYARTLSIPVGASDPSSIAPGEARPLFLAVTPMTDDLRGRCADAIDRGVIVPERLCYTLLASLWSSHELDYILATSPRASNILVGGAPAWDRPARLAEVETCRAALMLGMLIRRIESHDRAGGTEGVRVFEDSRGSVRSRVLEDVGAVFIAGVTSEVPWLRGSQPPRDQRGQLIVVPRGLPVPSDFDCVAELERAYPGAYVALLVPSDMAELLPKDQPVMLCPDRQAQLDAAIERKLVALDLGRA